MAKEPTLLDEINKAIFEETYPTNRDKVGLIFGAGVTLASVVGTGLAVKRGQPDKALFRAVLWLILSSNLGRNMTNSLLIASRRNEIIARINRQMQQQRSEEEFYEKEFASDEDLDAAHGLR